MFDPQKYNKQNQAQAKQNLKFLQEYEQNANWKRHCDSVIDVGSGDGDFTRNELVKMLPITFKEVIGCDKSEAMVQFANEHYRNDRISFEVLDIEETLPRQYYCRFNQVFSFQTLNWVQKQEKAFYNIFDLLAPEGGCFLLFVASSKLFENWKTITKMDRWRPCAGKLDELMPPYQDCPNPEVKVKEIMTKVGFTNVSVHCRKSSHCYGDRENFRASMGAVNFFGIPEDDFKDFLSDFIKLAEENGSVDEKYELEFSVIVARASKSKR